MRFGFTAPDDALRILQDRGVALGSAPEPFIMTAAYDQVDTSVGVRAPQHGRRRGLVLLGLLFGLARIRPQLRARNMVERVVLAALVLSSTVAILTTVGIILSMLFETIHFFSFVSPLDYFLRHGLGSPASPPPVTRGGGGGQFGLLPLLWGTLYISIVALLVAVPVGLFGAIYMSEYANRQCARRQSRSWRSSPASRPSSTACSRSSPSGRSCAIREPQSGSTSRPRAC